MPADERSTANPYGRYGMFYYGTDNRIVDTGVWGVNVDISMIKEVTLFFAGYAAWWSYNNTITFLGKDISADVKAAGADSNWGMYNSVPVSTLTFDYTNDTTVGSGGRMIALTQQEVRNSIMTIGVYSYKLINNIVVP